MAHSFKFDVVFTFFILIIGFHLGSVQLKDVSTRSLANDDPTKIQVGRAKEKVLPLMSRHMTAIQQLHHLMGSEHLLSSHLDSQRQSPTMNSVRHQFK